MSSVRVDEREGAEVPDPVPYSGAVFGRDRTPTTSPEPSATTGTTGMPPGGKGRPTPTRREAEAARRAALKPARSRRESVRQQREAGRAERVKAREAMLRGDERALPARDQGPVRRFVRDFVDSRRTAAEFFFWIALAVLVGSFVPNAAIRGYITIFWLAALLLIVVDSTVLSLRLRSELARRFPDESRRGTTWYALMRTMQIRRLRLPPPAVKPGQPPRPAR
jgi:hypothetical protein